MDAGCYLGDHLVNWCYLEDIVKYIISLFSEEVYLNLLPSNIDIKVLQCDFLKV